MTIHAPALRVAALASALALATAGCGSPARGPDPTSALVVGVSQEGGAPLVRSDGSALLSEAYTIYRDGRVVILENYAGTLAPAQRASRASPEEANKLFRILRSDAWRALPDGHGDSLGDDVKFTVETEGKSVSRSQSGGEPVFREVLSTLQGIRRRGG